jgi:SWI/SNF-related matrix-associated actin-dependent regulator 1 of chromatin subfamily A
MILTKRDNKFVALTLFEEKDIPKSAGFKWDIKNKYWYTNDPTVAAKLYGYADLSCKSELESMSKQYDKSIEASKAKEPSSQSTLIVPAPLGMEYRPYQIAGIEFVLQRPASLIADDMGLGKSVQSIGLANLKNDIEFMLIICPNTLKLNWRDELGMWLVRKLNWGIVRDNGWPKENIVIINYEQLKKYHDEIRSRQWDLVIADECHFCKNPKAIRTIQVVGKKERGIWTTTPIEGRYKLALTGTPLLNRPIELFPILNWLDPTIFDNYFRFGLRYANGRKGRFGWDFTGHSNLKELQQKMRSTVMIRRRKDEVLTELPPKIRQIVEIPASSDTLAGILKERETYDRYMDEYFKLKEDANLAKISDNHEAYLEAVDKLKECKSIAFTEMARARHELALVKLPILSNHIKDMLEGTDEKIVLFAHHHDMINGLASDFQGQCAILTGEQDIDEKNEAVLKFVNDPTCRLFLGSIKAAGIGLNKLQLVCSHGIFAEEDWVPAWMTQCEDRLHRFGQTRGVLIQHVVLEGSMDSMMAKRIVKKQDIYDRTLDKGLEIGDRLTLEEMASPDIVKEDNITPDQITLESNKLNFKQVEDIHEALRLLSSMCDGARSLDGTGFNKFDVRLGKNLANTDNLSAKAAALGRRIVLKYHKQLPEELLSSFKELV